MKKKVFGLAIADAIAAPAMEKKRAEDVRGWISAGESEHKHAAIAK